MIFSGCKHHFDPEWHVFTYGEESIDHIVSVSGHEVYFEDEEEIFKWACLHEDKLKELAKILYGIKMRRSTRIKIMEKLNINF